MTVHNEDAPGNGPITIFKSRNYKHVQRDEEVNLKVNGKKQREMHNRKRMAGFGRIGIKDAEFEKILTHLKGGRSLEKGNKLLPNNSILF